MDAARPLFVPVILGTSRRGRRSEQVARLLLREVGARPAVETALVDVAALELPFDDAGEALKDDAFAELMNRADAIVIVAPEYNHGYPGPLKQALDTNLKEYIHKAAGVVGVSAGATGGNRVIQNLLPVLRELGLVTIFWDVQVTSVARRFDDQGELVDDEYLPRIAKFLDELLWMADTLRRGREQVVGPRNDGIEPPVLCDACGVPANHQADKLVLAAPDDDAPEPTPGFEGAIERVFACPVCGRIVSRTGGASA